MRFVSATLLILFVSCLLVTAQTGRNLERVPNISDTIGSRTALVIGNGGYANAPLKNPVNDAADMAAALKSLGFEVLSYTNLDQNAMKRAIRDFGRKLHTNGSIGLFYYAGHGVQVRGVNYLIPIGASVNSEEEVEYEGVDAGLVLAQMEAAKNAMNIVILDACRNNPFARSYRSGEQGLAQINAPSGTLIAYSTAPGSVAADGTGRNGLYTQELLKQIRTSGRSIEEVFKQVRISVRRLTTEKQTPWESSSLTGEFYFSGRGPIAISSSIAADTTRSQVEDEYWNKIQAEDDPRSFENYLLVYPAGKHASAARQKLARLSATDSDGFTVNERIGRTGTAWKNGNFSLALEEANKAILIDPESAKAYNNRGVVYLAKKDLPRAIADFDRAIALDPNYYPLYNGRGLAFHQQKLYDKAIVDFSKAIELNPKFSPSYSFRADSYEKLGDKESAARDRVKYNEIKSGKK